MLLYVGAATHNGLPSAEDDACCSAAATRAALHVITTKATITRRLGLWSSWLPRPGLCCTLSKQQPHPCAHPKKHKTQPRKCKLKLPHTAVLRAIHKKAFSLCGLACTKPQSTSCKQH
jgi:hypothetical protein